MVRVAASLAWVAAAAPHCNEHHEHWVLSQRGAAEGFGECRLFLPALRSVPLDCHSRPYSPEQCKPADFKLGHYPIF